MVGGSLLDYLRRLRQSAAPDAGLDDGELLRRWVAGRDQAAFEVLVWRHGPMVLSLCQRWLSRPSDAEDAFQATFFTLARKASSVRSGDSLAAWLHRVSLRICLRARSSAGQPSALEADVPDARSPGPLEESSARELRAILDEEVNRLPERYRVPFVLCCLAGHSNAEAASRLGRPVGTIQSRLATARQRLRIRLSKRGLAPTAVAGVLTLAESGWAAVPAVLVSSTVQSSMLFAAGGAAAAACSAPAVALTEGVLKAMLTAKIKAACAVVVSIALLGTGGGVLGYRTFGTGSVRAEEGDTKAATSKPARDAALRKQLEDLRAQLEAMRKQLEEQQKIKTKEEELQRSLFAAALRDAQSRAVAGKLKTKSGIGSAAILPPGGGGLAPPKPDKPGMEVAPPPADARDSLELLKAQVEIKQAQVAAALVEAKAAKTKLARMKALGAARAVSQEEMDNAQSAVDSAEAQVRIRQAEMKESLLRVKQAEKRLKAAPDAKAMPPAADKSDERLLQLEAKLTELLKEVQALRAAKKSGTVDPARGR
jgi:RNA polymerase sigma factor (sigma-70 family)